MASTDTLVADATRRLLASTKDMHYGTATLVLHVLAGRVVRVEVARAETFQPAPEPEAPRPGGDA